MNPFELFQSRRCIRSYTGAPVSDEDLQKILQAANTAPTSMGEYENVHLTVITDPKLLAEIESACAEFMGQPGSHPLYGAPTLVVASSKFPSEAMANPAYSNAAILVHTMSLAATALGVGCCYIWGAVVALSGRPELVQALGLPEGFVPCCGLALGQSEEGYTPREIPQDRIGVNYVG